MLDRHPIWKALGLVCGALLLGAAPSAVAQETVLVEFEIEDQFKTRHTDAEYRGQVLVLVAGGRKGSEFTGGWQQAVIEGLADLSESDWPTFLGYADAGGVPFFLKGMIRGYFPQDPGSITLVDWKGQLADAYQTDPDEATLLLFGRDGRLVARTGGTTVNAAQVEAFVAVLRETLASDIPRH